MTIKRYSDRIGMIRDEDGEWVKYEDYREEADEALLILDKLLALNKEYKKL